MDDRDQHSDRQHVPLDPERAAARHSPREHEGRQAGESMRSGAGGKRFRGEEGRGERGYRGYAGDDTPPGAAPGGSYGAGGGYQRGGYERGNYDPGIEQARGGQGRSGWRAGPGGAAGGGTPGEPRPYGGLGEYRSPRGQSGAAGGDWRQGYGGYGVSEQGGALEAGGMDTGRNMFGQPPQEEPGGYGFGGEGGSGGYGEARGGDWGTERPEHLRWGEEGGPNRGSQGPGWRGEPRWEERSRAGSHGGGSGLEWQERARGSGYGGQRGVEWQHAEPWSVPGPYTGRGPEGYQRSEEAIRNDVCERLTRHGRLDASRIRVSVEQGEVVLEGQVDSRTAKRMAEDTAESVMGVRDVHNRLRIDERQRD